MKTKNEQQRAGDGSSGSGREIRNSGRGDDGKELFDNLIAAGIVDPVKCLAKADEAVKALLQKYPALYVELAQVLTAVDEVQHEAEIAGFLIGFSDALEIVNGLLAYTGMDLKTLLEKAEKHERERNQDL